MKPYVSVITLGVRDMSRARQFYKDGLGWPTLQDYGGWVCFALGNGASALGLFPWDDLAADVGVPAEGSGFRGVTLSYIVRSDLTVDRVLADAVSAGGTVVKPAQPGSWGGYYGSFADPDGYVWKVAAASGDEPFVAE
jgi:uncharacterized protein